MKAADLSQLRPPAGIEKAPPALVDNSIQLLPILLAATLLIAATAAVLFVRQRVRSRQFREASANPFAIRLEKLSRIASPDKADWLEYDALLREFLTAEPMSAREIVDSLPKSESTKIIGTLLLELESLRYGSAKAGRIETHSWAEALKILD